MKFTFSRALPSYLAAAVLSASFASPGMAGSISIVDPSFEVPVAGLYCNLSIIDGACTNLASQSSIGWQGMSTGGAAAFIYAPPTSVFPTIPDGIQVGAVGDGGLGATMFQTLTTTLAANTTYSLSFFEGNPALFTYEGYQAGLSVNGTFLGTLDTNGVSPTPGQFLLDNTYSFDSATLGPASPLIGQDITIDFIEGTPANRGGTAAFDSVQLTSTPDVISGAPEPATYMTIAGGLLAFGAIRRRKSRRSAA